MTYASRTLIEGSISTNIGSPRPLRWIAARAEKAKDDVDVGHERHLSSPMPPRKLSKDVLGIHALGGTMASRCRSAKHVPATPRSARGCVRVAESITRLLRAWKNGSLLILRERGMMWPATPRSARNTIVSLNECSGRIGKSYISTSRSRTRHNREQTASCKSSSKFDK